MEKESIFNFEREALCSALNESLDASNYRGTQVFEALYKNLKSNLDDVSNIPKDIKEHLKTNYDTSLLKILSKKTSSDGSIKYLFKLPSGPKIETVLIKQEKRMTLCVSSQYGCGMGCTFCMTGTMGFLGNLTTAEIILQVLTVMHDTEEFRTSFSNIVFMGMGEPLHNYKAVTAALRILLDPKGLAFPPRRITISSVGLVPAIKRFSNEGINVNLAISLNASDNDTRNKIMPINKNFPIEVLIDTIKGFPLQGRKKVTIEYVMLSGVNDTKDDLLRLKKIIEPIRAKVNLIPYNENTGLGFKSPNKSWINHWSNELNRAGFSTTVRWSKGKDIDAACGQLSVKALKKQKQEQKLKVLEDIT